MLLPRPPVILLEREAELRSLAACWAAIDSPGAAGCNVLVQAEAGGGKTALLRAFAAEVAAEAAADDGRPTWWCTVEQRLASEPLAALRCAVPHAQPLLAAGVPRNSEWLAGWQRLLRERPRPLLWVIDDVQWADSATLELLRYLARRIAGLRLMLVLLVRSEAVSSTPQAQPLLQAPLQTLLGALPPAYTLRLAPAPLSPGAVARLAVQQGRVLDAAALHRMTGGNPFLVAEAVAAPLGVPPAVRDQVAARRQALGGAARDLLDLVATAGGTLDVALAEALLADSGSAIDEACASALLHHLVHQQAEQLVLRHDLVRQALLAQLNPAQLRGLHERLLLALQRAGAPPARCAWHAHQAGIGHSVLALAPAACRAALAAGSAREAADLIDLVLPWIDAAPERERAALWVQHAVAQAQAQRPAAALRSRERALALHRAAGEHAAAGLDLLEAARARWLLGDLQQGLALAAAATTLLDAHGSARERAAAQATMAQLHLFDARPARALHWGRLALAHFEASGDTAAMVDVLNTVGFAQAVCGSGETAWAPMRRCQALALQHGLHAQAARACVNRASLSLVQRNLGELAAACEAGLALARAHDLDLHLQMLLLRQAWGLAHQGRLADALAQAQAVLLLPGLRAIEAQQAERLVALLQLRLGGQGAPAAAERWRDWLQGDAGSQDAVDPWYAPLALLRLEAAWLLGQPELALQQALAAWPQALERGEPWRIGMLAAWVNTLGGLLEVPQNLALPEVLALEVQGRFADAAALWSALDCHHDAAVTLALVDPAAATVALERMGARGTLRALQRERRSRGVLLRQRGSGRATRGDPLGLTPRERAVLNALAQGLSNKAIAQTLSRSERTVEHHVAALLAKLQVTSRAEAVRRWQQGADAA
jgi:DNA-binding CsgD family transcriptional regulator